MGWGGHVGALAAGEDPAGADHLLQVAGVGSDVASGERRDLVRPGADVVYRWRGLGGYWSPGALEQGRLIRPGSLLDVIAPQPVHHTVCLLYTSPSPRD
eukprot:1885478-Alexandrium_andersonii.AAC.1